MNVGVWTFGGKGTNNAVEHVHVKQEPQQYDKPAHLNAWVETIRHKENLIIAAANELETDRGTLMPCAEKRNDSTITY